MLVGIGLGLQDAFRDLIAGFILLLEGNIRVGDVIKISPTSQEEPLVVRIKKINIRTTQIQTWEGNVLVIPNTILTRDKVENWSHGSKLTRFIINVTVAYGSNTETWMNHGQGLLTLEMIIKTTTSSSIMMVHSVLPTPPS